MQPLLTRRAALATLSATAGAALAGRTAQAQDRFLDIRPGNAFRPVTVAVTNFGGEADAGAKLSSVVTNDFKRCTFIQPVDSASFPEPVTDPDAPNLGAWKATNAQFVLTGRTSRSGGSLNTAFRLWDLSNGSQVAGQQYTTDAANARRVAHIVADAVFTRVTGEKGFFDSRVVFVDETGSAEKRRKRLAIMDQDGFNVKYLTRGEDLVVTPRFSPSGQEVA
ncbi:MAG: Tol-Pal system protein TolB, partial [Caulobacteraceae bacterium]|nr:Tol-Pal system protein TolB [Caulobacter sp.]